MRLKILDETMEFPNDQEAIPEISQTIEEKLDAARLHFSHFIADGQEQYDRLDDFLWDHIAGLETIKIIACTYQELARNILLSAWDYLKGATPKVEKLAAEFYKGAGKQSWQSLAQLSEGMQWLLNSFDLLDQQMRQQNFNLDQDHFPGWEHYLHHIHSLKEKILELNEAISSNDQVLVGDLLNYEIVDLFKQLQEQLGQMLPWEA